jgi:hypothetical protein
MTCSVTGNVPLPAAVPQIKWRAGVDLNPIDATDPEQRRWLQCLVWPEHTTRAAVLDAALGVAAGQQPRIVEGDLVEQLPALIDEAPHGATVVVLHSATLAYVAGEARDAVRAIASERGAHRLGAEAPHVLPDLRGLPPETATGRFVVSLDDQALALADPHGHALNWLS